MPKRHVACQSVKDWPAEGSAGRTAMRPEAGPKVDNFNFGLSFELWSVFLVGPKDMDPMGL